MNTIEITSNPIKEVAIEEVLSSRGRVRIIKLLAEYGELNISAISKKVALNHTTVKEHLKFLVEVGIVKEKKFGRIRIYQYMDSSMRAHSLKELFKIWE